MTPSTVCETQRLNVLIEARGVSLAANIFLPAPAHSLVIFAHGSGSNRHSPRNRFVAGELNDGGIATMLVDLLNEEEAALDEHDAQFRFDISLLSTRLIALTDWVHAQPRFAALPLGYFGASTGAAAALAAAASRPQHIRAVVSRGGRPDLAALALPRVHAASLFIVGGADDYVLNLNQHALALLPTHTPRALKVIPGATHLFAEPGALSQAATLAREWFLQYLNTQER